MIIVMATYVVHFVAMVTTLVITIEIFDNDNNDDLCSDNDCHQDDVGSDNSTKNNDNYVMKNGDCCNDNDCCL